MENRDIFMRAPKTTEKQTEHGTRNDGLRKITVQDIKDMEWVETRYSWKVYMTTEELSYWTTMLPSLVSQDPRDIPLIFPRKRQKTYKTLVDTITNIVG